MNLPKIAGHLTILLVIAFFFVESHASTDEDLIKLMEKMLKDNGLTTKDVPEQLQLLVSKYYNFCLTTFRPTESFEHFRNDMQSIKKNNELNDPKFKEFINRFLKNLENESAIDEIVSEMFGTVRVPAQLVSLREGIKFLLFKKTHPRAMELVISAVTEFYDIYEKRQRLKHEEL